jgi:hypothetical protein
MFLYIIHMGMVLNSKLSLMWSLTTTISLTYKIS